MESFHHKHLEGLTIEPVGSALRIDYSEPDQGGTVLLTRFRVPLKGNPEIEYGYRHDAELTKREIAFEEIPPRVIGDAEAWLTQQLELAQRSGKKALIDALSGFQDRLRGK